MTDRSRAVRHLALDGILFALAVVLSIVEGMLPIPAPVPGVRLGLANITVMYAMLFIGKRDAVILVILKGLFGMVTRGFIAGLLSLAGGLSSIFIMIVLLICFNERVSYAMLSVCGALFHNMGQLLIIYIMYPVISIIAFAPMLILSGIAAGLITSIILKQLLPAARRFGFMPNSSI